MKRGSNHRLIAMTSALAVALLVTVLPAGLIALIVVRYRRAIRAARVRVAGGSRIAETACGPIEYAVAGEGPPVLVVHGAGGGYDQGLYLARDLAQSGFRVIAMSRFGYLRTPVPADASAAAQADAHARLLDALGIPRAAVVGASAGAPSAMQFALRHPGRTSALVLLVPAAYAPAPARPVLARMPPGVALLANTALRSDFLFWTVSRVARRTVIRALLGIPAGVMEHAGAEDRARAEEALDLVLPLTPRRSGLLNDAAVVSTLPRYELERIAAPTLVMSMADDGTFEGARYCADHIPRARFLGYASGGHLGVGHQAEAAAEIVSFLKTNEGAA